jgi:hypothetical protein
MAQSGFRSQEEAGDRVNKARAPRDPDPSVRRNNCADLSRRSGMNDLASL